MLYMNGDHGSKCISCNDSLYGVGAPSADVPPVATSLYTLKDSDIEYRNRPRYLRIVEKKNDPAYVLDYAAAGFHISMKRGAVGGCRDLALDIDGTKPDSACKLPLGQMEYLSWAWNKSAEAYAYVYHRVNLGLMSVTDSIPSLMEANLYADEAYRREGIDPPRDPELSPTAPSDPVGQSQSHKLPIALAVAGLLAAGLWWWTGRNAVDESASRAAAGMDGLRGSRASRASRARQYHSPRFSRNRVGGSPWRGSYQSRHRAW